MNADNLIRKVNQRLKRLSKWAGGKAPALIDKANAKIERLFGKTDIYRFFKEKYIKEHKPKNEKEIKTLEKRASNYALKIANDWFYEYRGDVIQIRRSENCKEYIKSIAGAISNAIPTTGQIKAEIAAAGKDETPESANEMEETKENAADVMREYYNLEESIHKQNIARLAKANKGQSRKKAWKEITQIVEEYQKAKRKRKSKK